MSELVSDFLLKRLREWGVNRIFAFPGDGINGLLGAFNRAGDKPKFVQVRHEEMAAFMACAHAKFTGEVGVCMATSGPGAIHLLNGLYDAQMDHQPVVMGDQAELFVDANGAYSRKEALAFADVFAESGVSWFEEPVSSDDLEGLRLLRDRAPAGMDVAAGEYGYDLPYFRHMLDSGAVDVLQADASRCAGITEFLRVGALCEARSMPLSAHCGPSLHAHPCCALSPVRHIEYFHDHERIEHMLFDGALTPVEGALHPDLSRPGLGLDLKCADAERYAASY